MKKRSDTFIRVKCLSLAIILSGCKSTTRNIYVSARGSDANPGTEAAPFATLTKAIAAVRDYKRDASEVLPVKVMLRGGRHSVTKPIVFTPRDSGTPKMPITYASYPGERAVISAGKKLSGSWSKVEGEAFWKLSVPEAAGRKFNFFSLYVDGESRVRARAPNWGEKVLRAAGQEPGGDSRQALRYFGDDIDPSWTNPNDIDLVLLCSWTPTLHRVTKIIPETKVIRFNSGHGRKVDFWEKNFRYYLSNVFEALDQPGEWYLNRDTGTLYYYPLAGENPNELEFIAPVMKSNMLQFNGDLEKHQHIEHLNFEEIAFRHLDGDMDKHNGFYRQGHMYLTSAVVARGLRNSTFKRCVFSQLGEYALELADGCRDITIEQCHFWDIGAGAIQTGVTTLTALKKAVGDNPLDEHGCAPERKVENITIRDNYIHKLGNIWHGCYGIVNRFASHSKIKHNEIFDIHWDAIGLDARWSWDGHKYCEGAEVAYNHLHNLGLGYHTDAGGVYQFGALDTHIHHNLIHDAIAYPHICGYAGIYLDQQSRGALVENNLVYNTDWFALFLHKGVENTFRNNLCAFSRDGLIARGSRNRTWPASYMDAYRNIYISTNSIMLKRDWDDGERPPLINSNLYHSCSSASNLVFGGGTFSEWRKRGRDINSVIADSGCKDPLNFDFSLAPDAKARQAIGFKSFDSEIKKAGLTCDKNWMKLPKSYAPRQPTKVWSPRELRKFAAFNLDFDTMPEGAPPDGIRQHGNTEEGGFFVTREVTPYTGKACLKARDRKSMRKIFHPYLTISKLCQLDESPIKFTFAIMQPEQNPGSMTVEFRGDNSVKEAGPSMRLTPDGKVRASGQEITQLTPGVWTRFTIKFGLKDQNTGAWNLTVKSDQGTKTMTLPFKHQNFDDVSWIGIMADSGQDSVFYLDDLSFKFGEELQH